MINISNEIRRAMKVAAEDVGNPYQFSIRLGVSNATVLKWFSGKTNRIHEETFRKMLPLLQPHMSPDEYNMWVSVSDIKPVEESLSSDENKETEAVSLKKFGIIPREVPILSLAQAAGYEPAIQPLCDYLKETSDRNAVFYDTPDNCFALEVYGDSMAPDYPNGSIALVAAGEYPQRGDIVAAKLSTGQIVIKEYHRKDNVIKLSSLNPNGKNFEWHCKEQPGYVQWMWPVVEITLRPRDRRWARCKMGACKN